MFGPGNYEITSEVTIRREPRIVEYQDPVVGCLNQMRRVLHNGVVFKIQTVPL